MDEERLRHIIREELGKALEGESSTTNYHLNVQSGPQPLLWPLMALAHKWRIIATGIRQSPEKDSDPAQSAKASTYIQAAKDLEDWIKTGALRLDP